MSEINEYLCFAGPQRRDRALHVLIGILRGMTADHALNEAERRELRDWVQMNRRLAERCPAFMELVTTTEQAISDGVVTAEEQADLLSLCERLETHSEYYGGMTHVLQELHGSLHGVIADGVVNELEAQALLDWVEEYEGFKTVWPVTEIESLLISVLRDGKISPEKQLEMKAFFFQFAELSPDSPVAKEVAGFSKKMTVMGICAADPLITFPGRFFCFTGLSRRASRKECHAAVQSRGGHCKETVGPELDYLVICAEGNPCWAYSCYGRKVEEAVRRRRDEGQNLLIVHESDFWDALK